MSEKKDEKFWILITLLDHRLTLEPLLYDKSSFLFKSSESEFSVACSQEHPIILHSLQSQK